jgi:Ca2+-transporting ATPase
MKRKPRSPNERLFTAAMLGRSVVLGLLASVISVTVYGFALRALAEPQARALGFTTLVVSNLSLIFVSRARSESLATIFFKANRIYWSIAFLALVALAVVVGVPSVAALFKFAAPPLPALSAACLVTLAAVLISGSLLRRRE